MIEVVAPCALAIATILGEAEGEPFEGKLAVARVIRERMRLKHFSDGTVAGTVLAPYQFSVWNTREERRITVCNADTTDRMVQDCARAWEHSAKRDPKWDGVVLYHADYVKPVWAKQMNAAFVVGRHIFYREAH